MKKYRYLVTLIGSLALTLSLLLLSALQPMTAAGASAGMAWVRGYGETGQFSQVNNYEGKLVQPFILTQAVIITGVVGPASEVVTVKGVTETLSLPMRTSFAIEPLAILANEGFEGSWPTTGWDVTDESTIDGGEYKWGKRNCHPHTGGFGGWSVGGGAQGNALACSANYPDNARSWAVYGPFNLSNATAASLTYHFWGVTEGESGCPFDFLFVGSSINNVDFAGQSHCGTATGGPAGNGYYQDTLNLSDRLGQSQVWVAFVFVSDFSITFNGMTIDDVTLDVTSGGTPIPPSNLTALALSQTQILLSWTDNSNNETGFKIEQSLTGVGSWTQIATTPANVTSHAPLGLTCNTTYYYRVRAYNAAGNSAYGNTANTTTLNCTPPTPPPSSLATTPGSQTQINLSWIDNTTNETGFKIERSPNGVNWTQIATVGANVTTYANTGLTCSTIYYYRVRAYNAAGDSGYSNTANATTLACSGTTIYLPIIFKACIPSPLGESNNISDALTICSGQTVSGQVNDNDWDDVYKILTAANQTLTISMNGTGVGGPGDADLFLYPPDTTDVDIDPPAAVSAHDGNTEFIQFTVPEGGFWYIDIFDFANGDGGTNYNVTVTLSGPGAATTQTSNIAETSLSHDPHQKK